MIRKYPTITNHRQTCVTVTEQEPHNNHETPERKTEIGKMKINQFDHDYLKQLKDHLEKYLCVCLLKLCA